ncbi:BON domain-containing protein [Arenimonas terrae]|uniref:BON domain-containing protein n=1 Tax=Arenimonas terrae TaxID=2546226 RepID=A0A5C4RQ30_9GAMM|nr:BON domain-containing protein [Arenimonas terrae]TNJ33262.1 BON domain-containing protein [Arenimonas terrae]
MNQRYGNPQDGRSRNEDPSGGRSRQGNDEGDWGGRGQGGQFSRGGQYNPDDQYNGGDRGYDDPGRNPGSRGPGEHYLREWAGPGGRGGRQDYGSQDFGAGRDYGSQRGYGSQDPGRSYMTSMTSGSHGYGNQGFGNQGHGNRNYDNQGYAGDQGGGYYSGQSQDGRRGFAQGPQNFGQYEGGYGGEDFGGPSGSQSGAQYGSRSGAQPQSFRGKGPKGYKRSDERLQEDLNERLMDDDYIDASDVTVQCRDGVVTLEGSVTDRRMKHRIEDLAERCQGVQDIQNRISVKRGSQGGRPDADDEDSGAAGSSARGNEGSNQPKKKH